MVPVMKGTVLERKLRRKMRGHLDARSQAVNGKQGNILDHHSRVRSKEKE